MAKSNRGNLSAVESTPAAQAEQVQEAAPVVVEAPAPQPNYTVMYRRDHPGGGALGRCSFGINGVSGIIVFDKALFAGAVPSIITMDCEFVQPKPDAKEAKAQAQAVKLAQKAEAAKLKLEQQSAKAAERQAKADKALADAKAKVEAAQAGAAKTVDAPAV